MQDFLAHMREKTLHRLHESHFRLEEMREQAMYARVPRSFVPGDDYLTHHPFVIAEIKFASPSSGNLYDTVNPVQIARQYIENGAACLSILTEPVYFKGDYSYITQVRAAYPDVRILMKDFIVDERQLYQARILGADAVLLMVSLLSINELCLFFDISTSIGLTPLIEVHSERELYIAEQLNPPMIGINNRNLKTLTVDLHTSKHLINRCNKRSFMVSESGIKHRDDMKELMSIGFNGFLVGSHLMRHGHPGVALHQLIHGGD